MAGRLDGKVAVVTGGANGIGRACSLPFAEEGANVIVADLQHDPGAETVALVEAAGARARFITTDTTREDDCLAMVRAAVDEFGGVDVAIAAAGIGWGGYVSGESEQPPGEMDAYNVVNQPLEHWEKVIDVNLDGVMLTNRAVARRMIEQGRGGSIINIASILAKRPAADGSAYCVSKAGCWMLTKTAALELAGERIRVNAIGPGYIERGPAGPFTATAPERGQPPVPRIDQDHLTERSADRALRRDPAPIRGPGWRVDSLAKPSDSMGLNRPDRKEHACRRWMGCESWI